MKSVIIEDINSMEKSTLRFYQQTENRHSSFSYHRFSFITRCEMNNFFFFLDLKTNTRGGECQAVRVGKFTIFSNGLRIISVHGALLCNIVVKEKRNKGRKAVRELRTSLLIYSLYRKQLSWLPPQFFPDITVWS